MAALQHPYAKYNANKHRLDDNLKLPLWQLVRASTAAPTYFPPEVILLKNTDKGQEKEFVFVDGGVTMYNNPAFQMFLMATLDRYWPKAPDKRWKAGAEQMLIVSVGTGTAANVRAGLDPDDMNLLYNASTIPSALMFAAQNEQRATLSIVRSATCRHVRGLWRRAASSSPTPATMPS